MAPPRGACGGRRGYDRAKRGPVGKSWLRRAEPAEGGGAMTDPEVEATVQEAFRSREHLVEGAETGLLDAVRGRVHRRRRTAAVAVSGLATLVVIATGAAVLGLFRGGSPDPGMGPSPARSVPVPEGWRLESS